MTPDLADGIALAAVSCIVVGAWQSGPVMGWMATGLALGAIALVLAWARRQHNQRPKG